jgi:S1-C subfamily serine protease
VDAAEKTTESVVFVNTVISAGDGSASGFHNFFGGTEKARATGSGVILSADGYIITNNHVVEQAEMVNITLNDRREFEAKIVARDPNTDLAVLKIDTKGLKPIEFANSDEVKIGQWVLAVGNPFNLTSTVTAGIISAKARNIGILRKSYEYSIESFLQTDAAVNPGNSGGALVNLNGELIGINTAIATETGFYAGYSFAIPSNLVNKVVNDLIDYGVVQRGFIGVNIRDVDAILAREEGLETTEGVYITGVNPNGAAMQAGLKAGDIIQCVVGHTITGTALIQGLTGTIDYNTTFTVKVIEEVQNTVEGMNNLYYSVYSVDADGVSDPVTILDGSTLPPVPINSSEILYYHILQKIPPFEFPSLSRRLQIKLFANFFTASFMTLYFRSSTVSTIATSIPQVVTSQTKLDTVDARITVTSATTEFNQVFVSSVPVSIVGEQTLIYSTSVNAIANVYAGDTVVCSIGSINGNLTVTSGETSLPAPANTLQWNLIAEGAYGNPDVIVAPMMAMAMDPIDVIRASLT